jgi:dihydrofolate reductase
MRRICYSVAMSLDGYIAGPQGEYDWIPMDPDVDFAEMGSRFDTLLMGRGTYQPFAGQNAAGSPFAHMAVVVASTTLRQADHPGVTIINDLTTTVLDQLRSKPGKDIWLFGGGALFRSLLDLGQVDVVEVAVVPVLLGGGVPFLPAPARRTTLSLSSNRLYAKSGMMMLQYTARPAVQR